MVKSSRQKSPWEGKNSKSPPQIVKNKARGKRENVATPDERKIRYGPCFRQEKRKGILLWRGEGEVSTSDGTSLYHEVKNGETPRGRIPVKKKETKELKHSFRRARKKKQTKKCL